MANDIDPNCRLALDINAELCKQSLEGVEVLEANLLKGDTAIRSEVLQSTDVILVGDMFYDEHIGSAVYDLCSTFKGLKRENEVWKDKSLKAVESKMCPGVCGGPWSVGSGGALSFPQKLPLLCQVYPGGNHQGRKQRILTWTCLAL